MKFSKGEHIFIYRSEYKGTEHKSYHLNVQTISKRHVTAIHLGNNNVEKTFNTSRFLEILDKNTSDDLVDERLKHHIDNYKNRELPSSFTHGGFFSKSSGHLNRDGGLVLTLKSSKQAMERDVKAFKLIIYYFQNAGKSSMAECKKFAKKNTWILLGGKVDYEFDDYNFTAEGKKDRIDEYKDDLEASKDSLKDLISDCKENGDDPELDAYVIAQKEIIESEKRYLKIVRSDFRHEALCFLCSEYDSKHEDSIFFDILRDFPINFEEEVTE